VAKKIVISLSLLIYLFPICFISGPAFTNLNIFFINILFIVFLIINKKINYLLKYKIFFAIYFYMVLSSLMSENLLFSLKSSIFFFRYIILVACINYLIENNFINIQKILKYFIFIIFIFFCDLLFEFFNNKNLFGFKNMNPERLSSFFNKELISGSFLSKLILIITPIVVFDQNRKYYLPFLTIGIFAVFITGERTSFYILLIFFSLVFFLMKGRNKEILIFYISVILLVFSFSLFNPKLSYRMTTKILNQANILDKKINVNDQNLNSYSKNKKIYYLSIDHEAHILAAYQMFKLRPIIGLGPNEYRNYACNNKYIFFNDERQNRVCVTHPHNYYIQILTELGVLGFVILIYVLIRYLKYIYVSLSRLHKDINFYNLVLIKNIAVLIFFIPFLPSGNFFGSYIGSLLFYTIGFLMSNMNNILKK
jgi:O-antigen ligase